MPYNGSGTFLRVMDWEADRDAGIKIRADRHDQEDDNFAAGLSNALTKDGQTQPVANIPMNGKRLINLGAPTSGTDATTKTYVDSIKKFINDIEVTDTVFFKDGSTTRGYIESAIGVGVAAKMTFETDNDAGTLVNRMWLDSIGLNINTGGFRFAPGGVLRASFTGATGVTPEASLIAYDNAGVSKGVLAVSGAYTYVKAVDVAQTAYTFRFLQSDNVIRSVLTSDFSQVDGKLSFDIRNTSGTVRNSLGLDINGVTLTTGKFFAPSWEFLDNKAVIDGNVNIGTTNNFIQFSGTSTDVALSVFRVRDNRGTTGAVGNVVVAIKRQNSSTDCLMFGNDGNSAGLIGANATALRLGQWSGGVFTQALSITGATVTATSNIVIDTPTGAGGINLGASDANSARLFFTATTKVWSIFAGESEGTLIFSSGGTFGSASGTIRARLFESGTMNFTGQVQATSFLGVASGTTGARFGVAGRVTAGAALAWLNAYDESFVEQVRIEISNNVLVLRPLVATTSALIRITNGSNQRRVELSYSSTNPFAIVARNDSDVLTAALVPNASGVPFWTYGSGTTSEMVTVASLNLTMYTGSAVNQLDFPVGTSLPIWTGGTLFARNAAIVPAVGNPDTNFYRVSGASGAGTALSGTWRASGHISSEQVMARRIS